MLQLSASFSCLSAVLLVGVALVYLSPANGANMTLYAIAVGQGDGNIIQCPNGRDILIVDMGATTPRYVDQSYVTSILKEKFNASSSSKNIHIVVTHSHIDHYNYLQKAIDADLLPNVQQIILGDTFENYGKTFKAWVKASIPNVYTVNGEQKCFGNTACKLTRVPGTGMGQRSVLASDPWQFCGSTGGMKITVLGANIGTTPNARSIILKIVFNQWSLFMAGDFEMVTPQQELINKYPNGELKVTYYKVAHHGAWTDKKPNLPALLAQVQPSKVYMSQGLPNMSMFHHPNCDTINNLLAVGSIVDINMNLNAPFVCWLYDSSKVYVRKGLGQAIYETCRSYDGSDQVCEDIMIESNGVADYTRYIRVPRQYLFDEKKLKKHGFEDLRMQLEDGDIETS